MVIQSPLVAALHEMQVRLAFALDFEARARLAMTSARPQIEQARVDLYNIVSSLLSNLVDQPAAYDVAHAQCVAEIDAQLQKLDADRAAKVQQEFWFMSSAWVQKIHGDPLRSAKKQGKQISEFVMQLYRQEVIQAEWADDLVRRVQERVEWSGVDAVTGVDVDADVIHAVIREKYPTFEEYVRNYWGGMKQKAVDPTQFVQDRPQHIQLVHQALGSRCNEIVITAILLGDGRAIYGVEAFPAGLLEDTSS